MNIADVDVLICGGIGGGAVRALSEAEIQLYAGASGNTDDVVNELAIYQLMVDIFKFSKFLYSGLLMALA